MKFQYFSDVNVQFLSSTDVALIRIRPEAPYLLICGDIGSPSLATYHEFLHLVAPLFQRVFVISGNQEAFGSTPSTSDASIRKIVGRFDNVTFMQNEAYHFPDSDVSVFGATFWTQIPYIMHRFIVERIADYINIHSFSPASACKLHEASVLALRGALESTPGRRWVVMSHHAPRVELSDARWRDAAINVAFASDVPEALDTRVVAWCFGHSTTPSVVRDRFFCNPIAYDGDFPGFDYCRTFTV